MPRRAKAKAGDSATRTRARRRKAVNFEIPPRDEAYAFIVNLRRSMLDKIRAGYGAFGAKEELEQIRKHAQALADAYPDLWEKACSEKEP